MSSALDQILLIPGIGRRSFNPASLFANNEVGGWYDPSDLSTLFQDVAGTTPVTASGQTVGLHLDKSKGGLSGLGPELRASGVVGLVGTATAATYNTSTGEGVVHRVDLPNQSFVEVPVIAGTFYRIEISQTTGSIGMQVRDGAANTTILLNITAGATVSAFVNPTSSKLVITGSGANAGFTLTSLKPLPGNHRYQASAGSRPQYVEDGALRYLLYDGVDDFLETNAVDFTGTDKMTVWWGGRKLSDAEAGSAIELSPRSDTNDGTFEFRAPRSSGAGNYRFLARGVTTAQEAIAASFSAPVSNVVTGIIDFAAPLIAIRANGLGISSNALSMGGGNFGNHKLFFGRRGGTVIPFNGREHQVIIRGAETDLATIEKTELFVRGKVGITW